ncbi:uncharacterized protein LOC122649534 [Telopea speciosissima]|uniref:uncharacterized protein LOC122649534 n=1 Tax=Telopea speciosissima TaxID=54955 RepID=UPI001CC3528F|nr:uncharacterized protein LOC122649534 [Telopea speciosissima]
MAFFRTLRSCRSYSFLRYQNTSFVARNPTEASPFAHSNLFHPQKCGCVVHQLLSNSSISQRTMSASTRTEEGAEAESSDSEKDEWTDASENGLEKNKKKEKKPLDVLFKEAVGLIEKPEDSESEEEEESQVGELNEKLRKLEADVRRLQENVVNIEKLKNLSMEKEDQSDEGQPKAQSKTNTLSSMFTPSNKSLKLRTPKEDKPRLSELSPEMVSLVERFYDEGYLRNANFLQRNRLDISCFSEEYPRDFLKSAAERFGQDHHEIATWLSGSDLKRVAQFGCPSIEKSNVFAAKRLRAFFSIQEDTVCRTCKLKSSCRFANQRVWKINNLNLADAMRILTLYDLGSVSPQLVVPDDMKASISKLLKEVTSLTE